MATFLAASWSRQSREQASRVQELLSAHVSRLGNAIAIVSTGLVAGVNFAVFVATAIIITPFAGFVMLAGGLVFSLLILPLSRITRRRSAEQAKANSNYSAAVTQVVSLSRENRMFHAERASLDTLAGLSMLQRRAAFQTRFLARITPVTYQLIALGLLVVGLIAANEAHFKDVGSLGAVVVLLVRAISYGQQLNTALQQSSEMAPYLEELLLEIDDYERNALERTTAAVASVTSMEIKAVSFCYEPGKDILHDVSVSLRMGETLGIVGPSGGGKSTMLQILLRLRAPTSGCFEINGVNAELLDWDDWTRRTAFVPQDNLLLAGTVLENIKFFRSFVSDDAAKHAARLAQLEDDIKELPLGFATKIGPGAAELSGGQKQRLGLARALAATPQILILDEPTSALDMRSEALIQETLLALRGTVTCVIVAHRISTISSCDRILVLEAGRVTALGAPAEVALSSNFFGDAVDLSRG